MKSKPILLSVLVILNFQIIFSQSYLTVKGKVTDIGDSKEIAYANVYIVGTYVGVVTNEAGEFELKFPESNLKDSLVVSCMGYTSFKQTLKKLIEKPKNLIQLSPKDVNINEVIITPLANQPELIFAEALKRIKDNYPQRAYYLDVFFRETEYCENNYLRLIESAIGIQDFGFDSNIDRIRIKLLELRKSDDFLEYRAYWAIIGKMFGDKSGSNILYESYNSDLLRNRDNKILFSKDFAKQYKFVLEDIKFENNTLIYVIRYNPKSFGTSMDKSAKEIEGVLYIRGGDYAIVKAEYNAFINAHLKNVEFPFGSKYFSKTTVSYRKINNKYYLNYLKCFTTFAGTPLYQGDTKSNWQKTETSFYVTNIYTSIKDFDRIKRREKEEKYLDLYKNEQPYNKEFWDKYNIILLNPIEQKIIKDIEKGKTIETQFKENSK
jgi:hypothetical protein